MRILTKGISQIYHSVEMGYCPNCGERTPEGAKFCPNCAKELVQQSEAREIAKIQDELHDARSNETGYAVATVLGFVSGIGFILVNVVGFGHTVVPGWLKGGCLAIGIGCLIGMLHYGGKVKKLRKKL
jgi:hypothetical protein